MRSAVPQTHVFPFLYAAVPVLFLYARDFSWQSPRLLVLPLLGCFALTLLFRAVFTLVFRDHDKGAIYASLFLLLFFTFGPLAKLAALPSLIISLAILIAAFVLLFRSDKQLPAATRVFTCGAVALTLAALLTIGFQSTRPRLRAADQTLDPAPVVLQASHLLPADYPHIFFIHVRHHPQAEMTDDRLARDHQALQTLLWPRDFKTSDLSFSNYGNRAQSLAATLNMSHLNHLSGGSESENRRLLAELIENSRVARLLQPLGYRTVSFATGDMITDIEDADFFLSPGVTLKPFHLAAIELTPLPRLWPRFSETYQGQLRQERNRYTLDHIDDALDLGIPLLTIACLDESEPKGDLTDSSHLLRLQPALDRLQERSDRPLVIIFQREQDFGSMISADDPADETLIDATFSLCAIRFPARSVPDQLAMIWPVNTFPIVFNACFGTKIPLREDKIFVSADPGDIEFRDLTARVADAWESVRAAGATR